MRGHHVDPRRARRGFMSISFRATAVRLAVVATAIVLAGGGAAASWAMSRPKAGTAAAPPPVDHQLCYSASGTYFKIPSGVRLINQFSPKGSCRRSVQPGPCTATRCRRPCRPARSSRSPTQMPTWCASGSAPPTAQRHCGGHQPVRQRDPGSRPAQPAVRAVVEEPDRPAGKATHDTARPQPLHLLSGEGQVGGRTSHRLVKLKTSSPRSP